LAARLGKPSSSAPAPWNTPDGRSPVRLVRTDSSLSYSFSQFVGALMENCWSAHPATAVELLRLRGMQSRLLSTPARLLMLKPPRLNQRKLVLSSAGCRVCHPLRSPRGSRKQPEARCTSPAACDTRGYCSGSPRWRRGAASSSCHRLQVCRRSAARKPIWHKPLGKIRGTCKVFSRSVRKPVRHCSGPIVNYGLVAVTQGILAGEGISYCSASTVSSRFSERAS
jgi:hypothetical protein